MMKDAVLAFPEQFAFVPTIQNVDQMPKRYSRVIVAGMGGSHLAADLLAAYGTCEQEIFIHEDYGLPAFISHDTFVIASSYSGNTEETIDAYHEARRLGVACAVMATGGALLKLAQEQSVPFIQIPSTGIQPRSALGFSLIAMATLLGLEDDLERIRQAGNACDPAALEETGSDIAAQFDGCTPIIYASRANASLAYNWKIKLNETGKIPAFYNAFPELNHNEMTGFDVGHHAQGRAKQFCTVLLSDDEDHPRIQKRMSILAGLYEDKGVRVERVDVSDVEVWSKVFRALLIADWTAITIAHMTGAEDEQVPMVESFKKQLA